MSHQTDSSRKGWSWQTKAALTGVGYLGLTRGPALAARAIARSQYQAAFRNPLGGQTGFSAIKQGSMLDMLTDPMFSKYQGTARGLWKTLRNPIDFYHNWANYASRQRVGPTAAHKAYSMTSSLKTGFFGRSFLQRLAGKQVGKHYAGWLTYGAYGAGPVGKLFAGAALAYGVSGALTESGVLNHSIGIMPGVPIVKEMGMNIGATIGSHLGYTIGGLAGPEGALVGFVGGMLAGATLASTDYLQRGYYALKGDPRRGWEQNLNRATLMAQGYNYRNPFRPDSKVFSMMDNESRSTLRRMSLKRIEQSPLNDRSVILGREASLSHR